MGIILLHSAQVEASRAILQELGLDAGTVDSTATRDGRAVRVVGKHALAVAVSPNFSAYPAIVVRDGGSLRVKSPVGSWAECAAVFLASTLPHEFHDLVRQTGGQGHGAGERGRDGV
jgi:hypothetical protein